MLNEQIYQVTKKYINIRTLIVVLISYKNSDGGFFRVSVTVSEGKGRLRKSGCIGD